MSSYNESCLLVNIYKKVALNYKGFYVFLLVCERNVNVCLHLCMFTCLCGCIQMRAYVSLKNTEHLCICEQSLVVRSRMNVGVMVGKLL